MQYPEHLKPWQHLLRIVYLGVLSAAGPMGEFAKWCASGTAAILALLIANLASEATILSVTSIKWGMIFLAASLLTGVFACQLGIAIRAGVGLIEALYAEFKNPEAQKAFAGSTLTPEGFKTEMISPFVGPIKSLMRRSVFKSQVDELQPEKRFIKMWCLLCYFSFFQSVTAIVGIVVLASGFR